MSFGAEYVLKLGGTEVRAGAPESLDQFIRTEIPRWAKVVSPESKWIDAGDHCVPVHPTLKNPALFFSVRRCYQQTRSHARAWHTASMLLPSGSRTNAA